MAMAGYEEPQQERGKSRWMWGCCGGCAGLALVAAVAIGVFIYFMVRSRPVVPPQTFFNAGGDAFAVLQVRPDNEELVGMLRHMAKNPPAAMDLTEEEKRRLESQAKGIPENLAKITPLQLVFLARHVDDPPEAKGPPKDGEMEAVRSLAAGLGEKKRFEYAGAASIKPYSGFVRWIFSSLIKSFPEEGGRTETYKGITLGVPASGNFYLAAKDNNFLFAEKKDVITGWLDALEEQQERGTETNDTALPPYTGPVALKSMYDRLNHSAPLYFATNNAHGEIGDFAAILAEYKRQGDDKELDEGLQKVSDLITSTGADAKDVEVLGGSFGLADQDTAQVEIYAECATSDYAQGLSTRLSKGIQEMLKDNENVTVKAQPRGNLARVTVTIENVQEALRKTGEQEPLKPPEKPEEKPQENEPQTPPI
jgi:hypothetical protein